jgi:cell division protein FtsW (lipid II flippase)
MNPRDKRIIAKSIFAVISITLVPIYTIVFGFKESPIKYTLSNICNFFDYRLSFILWGIITGSLLVSFILFTYQRAKYNNARSKRFLILSDIFLVLTVLTPALRDAMRFWYYVHTFSAALFALFLVASLLFFMHYLSVNNKKVYSKSLFFLLAAVGIPVSMLFVFDGLTGLAEIAFFVCISIFLLLLNVYLSKEQKDRIPELYEEEIDE